MAAPTNANITKKLSRSCVWQRHFSRWCPSRSQTACLSWNSRLLFDDVMCTAGLNSREVCEHMNGVQDATFTMLKALREQGKNIHNFEPWWKLLTYCYPKLARSQDGGIVVGLPEFVHDATTEPTSPPEYISQFHELLSSLVRLLGFCMQHGEPECGRHHPTLQFNRSNR